ncbi:hypothetical protein FBU59_004787 [Linderina macrospora]|uniref:Uncharacterized protein n=1 Tax=Linderina macrospora TaxID=4868 RepID=A0ACC1J4E8_9FUNG|nr:hypothetical protein FBU59_004787 [Linderina macrospora]
MIKGWQAKLVLLRRIAWMMATLYFLRSITISLTTLPPSLRECKPVLPKDTHELLAHIPGSMSGQISACTDKIFSGHTTILVVSFLFWTRYARHWAFIVYSAIHTVVGMISVLAVRYHYSIDVLLAIVLTFFVHHAYYTALDRAILLRTASPSIARARTFCNDNGVILAVPSGQGSSAYAYNRVQEDDNTIGGQMGLSPADIEKAMSRESSVAVTVPARADDEDLGTEYCVPGDFDEARIRLMAINRSMGSVLPRVVAWMDGLHLR